MYADSFADLFDHGIYVKYSPEGAQEFMLEVFKNFSATVLPILDARLKKTGKYLAGNKVTIQINCSNL